MKRVKRVVYGWYMKGLPLKWDAYTKQFKFTGQIKQVQCVFLSSLKEFKYAPEFHCFMWFDILCAPQRECEQAKLRDYEEKLVVTAWYNKVSCMSLFSAF